MAGAASRPIDTRAATLIVSPTGDRADFSSIQDALNALPPEGGTIFLREGTYNINSTILLPDKPVRIIGAGMGNTILDLGSNDIPLFEIGYDHPYAFEEFTILGDSTLTGQVAFHYAGTDGWHETLIRRIATISEDYDTSHVISKLIEVDSGDYAWVTADSLNLAVTNLYLDGDADLDMHSCIDLTMGGGGFVGSNIYLWTDSCILNISADSQLDTFEAIYSNFYISAPNYGFQISSRVGVYECNFQAISPVPRILDIAAAPWQSTSIVGCYFIGWTLEAIRLARSDSYIAGNINCKVTETGAANRNRYSDNNGFTGSTILGNASTVDGEAVRTVNANTILDENYHTVLVDASGGAITIGLPAAATCKYRKYTIKKIDASAYAITVDPNGTELIDNSSTFVFSEYLRSITIQSTGTAWVIV